MNWRNKFVSLNLEYFISWVKSGKKMNEAKRYKILNVGLIENVRECFGVIKTLFVFFSSNTQIKCVSQRSKSTYKVSTSPVCVSVYIFFARAKPEPVSIHGGWKEFYNCFTITMSTVTTSSTLIGYFYTEDGIFLVQKFYSCSKVSSNTE